MEQPRRSDPQFAAPLGDAEGEHAVRADGRQNERHDAEDREEQHGRATRHERPIEPFVHRADIGKRLFRIDALNCRSTCEVSAPGAVPVLIISVMFDKGA